VIHPRICLMLCGLLVAAAALTAGCRGGEDAAVEEWSQRIGAFVSSSLVFEGRTYDGGTEVMKTIRVVPDDLTYAGSARLSAESAPPDVLASNYRVFSIDGIDKSQAIAVRFESANGEFFYYLRYEARQ
jgi:hypothetical protein